MARGHERHEGPVRNPKYRLEEASRVSEYLQNYHFAKLLSSSTARLVGSLPHGYGPSVRVVLGITRLDDLS